ncbi:ABC ATP-binding protein, putative [Babesia ovata]|uniref:ABC ATP-binding protein, putative n=1 Tax=Babesia ovata TaxID=189622 RepID=A0A2H6KHD2_9APIC|nr:ABC ATP-binding protein, putative [Babesia ovata]GBE62400.1 ABC ATP-binding protein, putative [Babesia ovata]
MPALAVLLRLKYNIKMPYMVLQHRTDATVVLLQRVLRHFWLVGEQRLYVVQDEERHYAADVHPVDGRNRRLEELEVRVGRLVHGVKREEVGVHLRQPLQQVADVEQEPEDANPVHSAQHNASAVILPRLQQHTLPRRGLRDCYV